MSSIIQAMRQQQKDLELEEKKAKKEEKQRILDLIKKRKGDTDSANDYDDPEAKSPGMRSNLS